MSAGERIYKEAGGIRKRIAVIVDRSALSLVGCFGALFAGSCYVPIDSKMPDDRMNDILEQVEPSAVLYTAKNAKAAARLEGKYKTLMTEDIMSCPYDPFLWDKISAEVLDIDPAYMIFTSGSTGKPEVEYSSRTAALLTLPNGWRRCRRQTKTTCSRTRLRSISTCP